MVGFAAHDAAERNIAVEFSVRAHGDGEGLGQLVGAGHLNSGEIGIRLGENLPRRRHHAVHHLAVIGRADDQNFRGRTR
jgi:hypothetical protein